MKNKLYGNKIELLVCYLVLVMLIVCSLWIGFGRWIAYSSRDDKKVPEGKKRICLTISIYSKFLRLKRVWERGFNGYKTYTQQCTAQAYDSHTPKFLLQWNHLSNLEEFRRILA